jgi:taurine dioxygenase
VVVARGQRLSDPELLAFSRNFGELDPPGPILTASRSTRISRRINVISNVIENGRAIGGLGAGEAAWHAD